MRRRQAGTASFILALLTPGLLLYAFLVLLPMAESFRLALFRWRGVSGRMTFVGATNFQELLGDGRFRDALAHNFQFLLLVGVAVLTLGLFFGNALQVSATPARKPVWGAPFFRGLFLFPNVVSIVAVSILWSFLYNTNWGLVNAVLKLAHVLPGDQPVEWLSNPRTVLPAVAASYVWYVLGFYVLLIRAGIQDIPGEVVESALIDGCDEGRLFRHITLPMIGEIVRLCVIYLLINAMNVFALVWVMAPPSGTAGATEVSLTYLYQKGFVEQQFGYASAIGAVNFVLVMALTTLLQRVRRVPA